MNELNIPRIPALAAFLKRCATFFKMAGVTLLILLLLIPLNLIRSVLRERLERRDADVTDITSSWGREQSIIGPVLIVPYRYSIRSWKEQPNASGKIEKVEVVETTVANAYFLPSMLAIQGTIIPSRLHRGIYEAVVYSGKLELSGQFTRPDFASLRIEEQDVLWDDALVTFAIPDLRGVKGTLQMQWGTNHVALLPGSKLPGFSSGVFAKVSNLRTSTEIIPLRMELALNGSRGMSFSPVGAQNTVKLSSPWPDPSFRGAFLPEERSISRDGFEATWRVSHYGRDYTQQWTDL